MRSAKGIWHCNKTKLTDKSPCRRYKNCCPLTSFVSFVRLLFFFAGYAWAMCPQALFHLVEAFAEHAVAECL